MGSDGACGGREVWGVMVHVEGRRCGIYISGLISSSWCAWGPPLVYGTRPQNGNNNRKPTAKSWQLSNNS